MVDEKRVLPANVAPPPQAPSSADRSSIGGSSVRELSEKVVKAAESARGLGRLSATSLAQLRLAHMRLHGREGDLKLLRTKLGELTTNGGSTALPEIILVSGVSGTGKTALISRGLQGPAQKMGMTFVSGKFDLNQGALPLSAFAEAMTSLAKHVEGHENFNTIQGDIRNSFAEEDVLLLSRAMPGCNELLGIERGRKVSRRSGGKEMVSRQQYAIKRLLKIVCTHLNGLVLFIDDLQVSVPVDTTTAFPVSLHERFHTGSFLSL